VGNLYAESNYNHIEIVLRRMTYIYFCFATIFCTGYFCGITSFISCVFGKEYTMTMGVVLIMSINLYLHAVREPIWQMMSVSGLFRQDKTIAIIGTMVNLIMSIVVGRFFGIIGIFFGTFCTYIIQIVLKIPVLFVSGLNRNWWNYFIYWIKLLVTFCASLALSYLATSQIGTKNMIINFVFQGIISIIIASLLIIFTSVKSQEFNYFFNMLKVKSKVIGR
jgi:O-antigen/teichoic acid export membrane protein